jgi:hypothetical protein
VIVLNLLYDVVKDNLFNRNLCLWSIMVGVPINFSSTMDGGNEITFTDKNGNSIG